MYLTTDLFLDIIEIDEKITHKERLEYTSKRIARFKKTQYNALKILI